MYEFGGVNGLLLNRVHSFWLFFPFDIIEHVLGILQREQMNAIPILPRFLRQTSILETQQIYGVSLAYTVMNSNIKST